MKVGLFGGTFNPIHLGHLRSAEEVREAFRLDRIYFVPSARPPHKTGEDLALARHRLQMVELALSDNPCFTASAVELERTGKSYSIDTVRYFIETIRPTTLSFVMGLDAFLEIDSWKDYATIPELCNLIITSRPGIPTPHPQQFLPVALRSIFWYDSELKLYRHPSRHTLALHEIEGLNVSASALRQKVRRRASIRYLVPPVVESYIAEHALYQEEESAR